MGYMTIPDNLIDCMGSTSKGFRTQEASFMNKDKTFRDSGAGIHFVQEMMSPVPPKCLKVMAFFSNCINSCDKLTGCMVPTAFTKLTVEHKKVTGMQHVSEDASDYQDEHWHMDINRLMQYQVAIENGDTMVVNNKTGPVSCVARLIPVTFSDDNGKMYYRLFMITSLVPRSGVDLLACIKRITNPNDYSNTADKERALARQTLWKSIWLQELKTAQLCGSRKDAVNGSVDVDFDNNYDPMNPVIFCNKLICFKKIEAIVDAEQKLMKEATPGIQFTDMDIFGISAPRTNDEHSTYQKTCQSYCDRIRDHRNDFAVSSDHYYASLKSGTTPVVEYHLRHVPGLVINHSIPESELMMDLHFGFTEAPLTLEWSPLNALNFNEDWEKFDAGMLPLTTRVIILDFQQGTVEMNQSVLSDRDRLKAIDENRWNLYYCKLRDPLLEYVRPGCYAVWLKGIQDKLVSMLSDARTQAIPVPEMYHISRKIVDRYRMYFTQASRWHMAQIEIGEYRSDCLQGGHAVLREYKDELPALMKKTFEKYGRSHRDSGLFPLASQMRQCFYNCCLNVNKYANMTYANMELFVQLFTTDMLWHFGHNDSWTTFCQCIQVVPMKGTFVHTVQRGKNSSETSRFVAKPNSSGTDAIVSWWYNCMMMLPEKVRAGLINLSLTMVGIHRTTPVALERQSKVRIVGDRIMSEPNQQSRFRMQKMTEERYLDKASLAAKVRSLPRHKNANDDAGVNTTDMDENGRRVNERWVDIGGYFLGFCATNARVATEEEAESWNTLNSSQLWMSTGKYVTEKRNYMDFEDHEVIASTKTTVAIDDNLFQNDMCVPMCVIPKITAQVVALMNQFGLTSVEVDSLCRDLDSWFCFMFDLFFSCFASGMMLSFRRRLDGMQARTVAESSMSRFMMELTLSNDFDEALQSTCMTISYHAMDPVDVCVYIDDGIRQCMDNPFLVMHHIIAREILNFPLVDFDWFYGIMQRGATTQEERDSTDGVALITFFRDCLFNDRFLIVETSDGGGQMDFRNPNGGAGVDPAGGVPAVRIGQKVPYVTSMALDPAMAGAGADEFLRVNSKSTASPITVIGQSLRKSKHIAKLHRVAGLPMDEDMMFHALKDYSQKIFDISAYLCTESSLSPARLLSCFGLHNEMPASFHDGHKRVDSVNMGMFSSRQNPALQDVKQVAFGIHLVAGLLVTSLLGPTMMPNSTCDAVASGVIMQRILLQSPPGLMAPTGDIFLRKCFSGSVVQYDKLELQRTKSAGSAYAGKTAYFTRPKHDDAIVKDQTVQYMPCNRYKNYCPEDLLHMSNVIAALQYFKFDHIGMLPVDLVRPNYNMLYDVYYPVLRCREKKYQPGMSDLDLETVAMHGYVRIRYNEVEKIPKFQLFVAYMDEDGNSAIDRGVVSDCFTDDNEYDIMTLNSEAFGPWQLTAAPLLNRNNATLYDTSTGMFGVLLPLKEPGSDNLSVNIAGNVCYFSPTHISYNVLWQGTSDPVWVHVTHLDDMLLPLAAKVFLRYSVFLQQKPQEVQVEDVAIGQRDSTYVVAYVRYEQLVPYDPLDFRKMILSVARKTVLQTETFLYSIPVPIGVCNRPGDLILANAHPGPELPDGVQRLIHRV
jgi:hypothetical protein